MPLQEMSDRLEIQALLARYAHAIDTRDWDGLDDVFTPDAGHRLHGLRRTPG